MFHTCYHKTNLPQTSQPARENEPSDGYNPDVDINMYTGTQDKV